MENNWKEEFDNQFWEHRVPKNTKQSKDIKTFISTQLENLIDEITDCQSPISLMYLGNDELKQHLKAKWL